MVASPRPLQASQLANSPNMGGAKEGKASPAGKTPSRTVSASSTAAKKRPTPPSRDKGKENVVGDEESGEDASGDSYSRMSRESLVVALRAMATEKEQANIALAASNSTLSEIQSSQAALQRQMDLYLGKETQYLADQARIEEELAKTNSELESSQAKIRDLDKSKRDSERQSKEELAQFENAQTQWLALQQTLESRIATLTSKIQQLEESAKEAETPTDLESKEPTLQFKAANSSILEVPRPDDRDDEMAIKAELLLATQEALASLQSAYEELQAQHMETSRESAKAVETLAEIQIVNHRLMDENESFALLLGERTLNGEILGQGVLGRVWDAETPQQSALSPRNFAGQPTSGLGLLPEEDDYEFSASPRPRQGDGNVLEDYGSGSPHSGATPAETSKRPKKRNGAPTEGLDLAAELDRAEDSAEEEQEMLQAGPGHNRDVSTVSLVGWSTEGLKTEIRQLRDANKALSLYINKILERVIAQEGFENVLATDFGKSNPPSPELSISQPSPVKPQPARGMSILSLKSSQASSPTQSSFNFAEEPEPSTPITARPFSPATSVNATPSAKATAEKKKASRMSLSSIAASAASLWASSGPKSPPAQPNLRPMLLNNAFSAHSSPDLSGHLTRSQIMEYTGDDEEDARERQRLHAELKLLGIEKAGSPGLRPVSLHSSIGSVISDADAQSSNASSTDSRLEKRRSVHATSPRLSYIATPKVGPTTIADIKERDQEMQQELKAGRPSGFTEQPKRVGSFRRTSSQASSGIL